jgi:hypothetical protein
MHITAAAIVKNLISSSLCASLKEGGCCPFKMLFATPIAKDQSKFDFAIII